jgi:DNA repair photolyase
MRRAQKRVEHIALSTWVRPLPSQRGPILTPPVCCHYDIHVCAYCYARSSHIAFDMDGGTDFERHAFVKVNAPAVLRDELRHPSWRREAVHIGTIVDPYQPVEGRYRITRGMLQTLAAMRTSATLITKNSMVQRDIDVLRELQARAGVPYASA